MEGFVVVGFLTCPHPNRPLVAGGSSRETPPPSRRVNVSLDVHQHCFHDV